MAADIRRVTTSVQQSSYNGMVDRRRMCPNCRAFIDRSDRQCAYCGVKLGERLADRIDPDPIAGIIPPHSFMTAMLVLVNLAMFLACGFLSGGHWMGFDSQVLVALGAKQTLRISYFGEWWRLVTAGFLHGGIFHIGMNLYGLVVLGPMVEERLGPVRLGIIYVVTSATGFWVSMLLSPNAISVGASAAIFGIIGALVGYGIRNRNTTSGRELRTGAWNMAVTSIVLSAVPAMFGGINVDNGAHVGGLLGGILCGFVLDAPKLVVDWKERAVQGVGGLCLGITVYSLVLIILRLQAL